jgi:ribulose-5-phosphate 4-epimerase/fuculose-1-phosphate aldolase
MEIFTLSGTCASPFLSRFAEGITEKFKSEGYRFDADPVGNIRLVFNFIHPCHYEDATDVYFITPEQGCYKIAFHPQKEHSFYRTLCERLEPLASSQLVIDNEFYDDLPEELWDGDVITKKLRVAWQQLDQLNLLPAPFPIQDYLSARDMKHLKRLYGIGGLSYGNLSSRKDRHAFWMSAAGCNKADMKTIGKDILFVKGYDPSSKRCK